MKIPKILRYVLTTTFLLTCSIVLPIKGQLPLRVDTPGSAFQPEGSVAPGVVEDVAGGRRFRGNAGALLKLRGVLRIPSASSGDPKMLRLVVHFRASASGPSLRLVEVRNGANAVFRMATDLRGDYTARETTTPDFIANTWDFKSSPRTVGSETIVRLEVQFPIGFDSRINPGEFLLTSVRVDFPKKESSVLLPNLQVLIPPGLPAGSKGVIYAVAGNNDLMWYRHDGYGDGSFRWSTPRKVGSGWQFKQIFSGGGGVIYGIADSGDLMWYRHDGNSDGSFRWSGPKKVGSGWQFKQVFYGEAGVIYGITDGGELMWYRHDGFGDGSFRWSGPKTVGSGWQFKQIFYREGGVIYGITDGAELMWYRHDGHSDGSFRWSGPKKVGTGWAFREIFTD